MQKKTPKAIAPAKAVNPAEPKSFRDQKSQNLLVGGQVALKPTNPEDLRAH